jgi:hypothetical protein
VKTPATSLRSGFSLIATHLEERRFSQPKKLEAEKYDPDCREHEANGQNCHGPKPLEARGSHWSVVEKKMEAVCDKRSRRSATKLPGLHTYLAQISSPNQ